MRGDVVAVAIAEAFRGDGRILASPMGPLPKLGVRLAAATFSPGLLLTDGVATLVDLEGKPEGYMPYSRVFDVVWGGKRHVMMGASQLDQHGNQNISCIGAHEQPKVMLLGVRGGPGNTVCHPTSYFVARHSKKVFVPAVDMISGVGPSRGAREIRCVVTNLGVFDYGGPGQTMRLQTLHPGVTVEEVVENTGFAVAIPPDCPRTPLPTDEQRAWLEGQDPDRAIRGMVE